MAGPAIQLDTRELLGFAEGAKNAPKVVGVAIRSILGRARGPFRTKARRALLFGPPGIHLPARDITRSKTGRKGKAIKGRTKSIKLAQESQIKAVVPRGKELALVAYTSKFLTYHEEKIRTRFLSLFRKQVPGINKQIEAEIVRVTEKEVERAILKKRAQRVGSG